MKRLPFLKPRDSAAPAPEAGRDRLSKFYELRRDFYHLQMLMGELEKQEPSAAIAEIFAKAADRLSVSAEDFATSFDGKPNA